MGIYFEKKVIWDGGKGGRVTGHLSFGNAALALVPSSASCRRVTVCYCCFPLAGRRCAVDATRALGTLSKCRPLWSPVRHGRARLGALSDPAGTTFRHPVSHHKLQKEIIQWSWFPISLLTLPSREVDLLIGSGRRAWIRVNRLTGRYTIRPAINTPIRSCSRRCSF